MIQETKQVNLLQEYAQELRNIGEFAQELKDADRRLDELEELITANESKLNNQFIKVPFTKFKLLDDTGLLKPKTPVLLEENKRLVGEYNQLLEQSQINCGILNHKERVIGQKLQTLTDYPEIVRVGRAIVESIDNGQGWPDLAAIIDATKPEGK